MHFHFAFQLDDFAFDRSPFRFCQCFRGRFLIFGEIAFRQFSDAVFDCFGTVSRSADGIHFLIWNFAHFEPIPLLKEFCGAYPVEKRWSFLVLPDQDSCDFVVVSEKDGDLNGSGISHLPVVIGNALQIKLSEFCTFPIQHMVDSPACRLDFCRLRHGFCHVP